MSEGTNASIRIVVQFLDDGIPLKTVLVGQVGPYDPLSVTDDEVTEAIIAGLRGGSENLARQHYADKSLTNPQPEGSHDTPPAVDPS